MPYLLNRLAVLRTFVSLLEEIKRKFVALSYYYYYYYYYYYSLSCLNSHIETEQTTDV